jgi:hypothetical protein
VKEELSGRVEIDGRESEEIEEDFGIVGKTFCFQDEEGRGGNGRESDERCHSC